MAISHPPEAKAMPDRIGTLAHVTSPFWWVVVAVLLVLGGAVSIWALMGEVYVTVTGIGLIIPSEGVITTVNSSAPGRVKEIKVALAEQVKAKQVIASLHQERLAADLDTARESLNALEKQREQQIEQNRVTLAGKQSATEKQIASLQNKIKSLQQTATYQTQALEDLEQELLQGFATRAQVEQARSDKIATDLSLLDTSVNIQTLRTQLAQDSADAEQQLFSLDQQILKATQQVTEAAQALALAQDIVAPIDGRIASITTSPGKMVGAEDVVVIIEPESYAERVAAYFQIGDGKRIQPGSRARVKINSIDSDVYGTAVGTVAEVDELPSTSAGLRNIIENETLVSDIERAGTPLRVLIDLEQIENRPHYVKLSSGKTSPIPVTVGTTITAQVIVEKSAPISYVIRLFN